MTQNRIQQDISLLVLEHCRETGQPWHKCPSFPAPLCTIINPYCPDDLCQLPYGHVGTVEGYHVLGTTNYDYADRLDEWHPLLPEGTSRADLIKAGRELADRLFPEEPM